MSNELDLVISIWDSIESFIPEFKKEDAALEIITSLEDVISDHEHTKLLQNLEGENPYFDHAIEVFNENASEDEDDVDEMDFNDEGDDY